MASSLRRLRPATTAFVLLAAWCATGAAEAALDVHGASHGGPSVLAPFRGGASPYTGIGRYEGPATCTAFFLDTMPGDDAHDAPAYALTSGHCLVLPPNAVLVDRAGAGRVIFNYFVDSVDRQVAVPVARTVYAAMNGHDLAVLELAATYRDLVGQSIRPWPAVRSHRAFLHDPVAIVGAPLWPDLSESFLRLATCSVDGVAPFVLEHAWHWVDAAFNRCQHVLPGSSGSPVISRLDRSVVGLVSTTTGGVSPLAECALRHPCELAAGGATTRPDTTYATPVAGVTACFDERGRFSLDEPECIFDPGSRPVATPPFVGAVNPALATPPIGAARTTWDVAVSGSGRTYRYAVASSADRCRAPDAYGAPVAIVSAPVIDRPLPLTEGFSFLCIAGPAGQAGGDGGHVDAAVVVARIDTTPPVLPAQITIHDRGAAWRVQFGTVGEEVLFHAFKVGHPARTHCEDPAGYRLATPAVGLPKAGAPYRLCAIPYDAARNAGRLFETELQ